MRRGRIWVRLSGVPSTLVFVRFLTVNFMLVGTNYRMSMADPLYTAPRSESTGATIQSLETTLTVISELEQRGEAGVTELATAIGVSKSSVHKHLTTLRRHDFVVKEGDAYQLGMRFLDVAGRLQKRIEGANLIQEKVRELAETTEETAQFAVAEHGRAVIVFREAGSHGVYTKGRVGKRFYIHQTSTGKAMLSRMNNEEVRWFARHQGLPKLTEDTITDIDTLIAELEEIRERGYAINRNETTRGLRSVGVPVHGAIEEVIGAIAVVGPSSRMRDDRLERELPELIQGVVNELELNLAYS